MAGQHQRPGSLDPLVADFRNRAGEQPPQRSPVLTGGLPACRRRCPIWCAAFCKEITWSELHVGSRDVLTDAGFAEVSHPAPAASSCASTSDQTA
jgi:hypothetical protein